jgi:hypothetical protein
VTNEEYAAFKRSELAAARRLFASETEVDVERLTFALIQTGIYIDEGTIDNYRLPSPRSLAEAIAREYTAAARDA